MFPECFKQAVLRVIYSYLMDLPRELAPRESIPLHTVIKVTYGGGVHSSPSATHTYLGPDVAAGNAIF
jgi:broad specificity phosphatase PhoE